MRGLMTLALFSADPDRVSVCFRCLRELRDRLRGQAPDGVDLDRLSMGAREAVHEPATTAGD